jgi:hypothetical protein
MRAHNELSTVEVGADWNELVNGKEEAKNMNRNEHNAYK